MFNILKKWLGKNRFNPIEDLTYHETLNSSSLEVKVGDEIIEIRRVALCAEKYVEDLQHIAVFKSLSDCKRDLKKASDMTIAFAGHLLDDRGFLVSDLTEQSFMEFKQKLINLGVFEYRARTDTRIEYLYTIDPEPEPEQPEINFLDLKPTDNKF